MSRVLPIIVGSYLLGSIPFGYLLVRIFRGEDVRASGSGNIGATNVSRKSPALGVLTLVLDAAKGSAAVALSAYFCGRPFFGQAVSAHAWNASAPYGPMSLAALFAVVGHIFPLWLKFRGGKGVATGLGSFAMIAPKAVLIAAGIFVIVVLALRYVSLASIVSVLAFPLLAWLLHEHGDSLRALLYMSLASILIVLKHHQNIRRLLAGTENRFGVKRT